MMLRALVAVAGAAVVAAATHANVMHAGGYGSEDAPLVLALACLLALGLAYATKAYSEGHRIQALALGLCLLCGEAYWLLSNAEREMAHRDAITAPADQARTAYASAVARVEHAEAAKTKVNAVVAEKSAERGCAANCRALLQGQVDTARTELAAARSALALLPPPRSASPLPERLGVPVWAWDLLLAGLRSIAVVGGSLIIGMALHTRRRPVPVMTSTAAHQRRAAHAKRLQIAAPTPAAPAASNDGSPREHVAKFLRVALQPDPTGETSLRALHSGYYEWCEVSGSAPLQTDVLGRELRSIVDALGLRCAREADDVVIRGAVSRRLSIANVRAATR